MMKRTEKRRTLVTGGAGFLGYHLCKRLIAAGDFVISLDDMTTGIPEHVEAFAGLPDFEFIRHDVREPIDVDVDRIFNLACPASPPAYQADPIKTTLTSVVGAQNMLDLACRNGARIVQASTSEVYGNPTEHPQPESYHGNVATMGPRSCYDEGKRCAETLFHDHHRQHGVDTRVARIFNTYGPGMRPDDGRVISNFIVEALEGRPLTVHGDGAQTRSFCYVDDLIDGLVRLMELEPPFAEPVNLGNPKEFTVAQLARLVLAETSSHSTIVHLPAAEDDPQRRRPDITRARELLGWEPKVNLETGLPPTIRYFRNLVEQAGGRDLLGAGWRAGQT